MQERLSQTKDPHAEIAALSTVAEGTKPVNGVRLSVRVLLPVFAGLLPARVRMVCCALVRFVRTLAWVPLRPSF